MSESRYVNVPMSCGHTARFCTPSPAKGTTVYCLDCRDYGQVISGREQPEYIGGCLNCPLDIEAATYRRLAARLTYHSKIKWGHTAWGCRYWQGPESRRYFFLGRALDRKSEESKV